MRYPYEDLDDTQFERLVVECLRALFGAGVQSFATGADGGRDALFVGTAEQFPSAASPWAGTTVGQAKHTLNTNMHYSDPAFSGGTDSSVLSHEAVRVKALVEAGEIDNYILFSNRRLGGSTGPGLTRWFAGETGLPADKVFFAGIEYLDRLLREHPEAIERARIDPLDGPLLVSSYDLAEVILVIAETLDGDVVPPAAVTDRVSYDEKNDLNGTTPRFAEHLSRNYMRYTQAIQDFLADPANTDSRTRYDAAVEDFQLKIIEKRSEFAAFDAIFNHLVDLMVGRDDVLARNRRVLRAVLFYMYWHCDIGETPGADSE